MSLRFVGIDPDTPNGGSPTVWLEDEKAEIVIQGWLPDSEMHTEIAGTEWVEGHPIGIPGHEGVVRVPVRMIPYLRKVCDDAERAGLCRPAEER
ncbi:conserved hypothetical protein [Streptomyces himastatinicus ATCC 53653]|uniref:Uncharacterized protein n=1 Tax=Streptomyces himastatinicus ATCC 53653 TaxID=457427 RepID=D9WII5_9ACTN|nr:hypothetical protein [Streptomyces himastatinicus]EFL25543.1 conserved hypothetical protein [Streptomyces himastatinicus ATCC 53653]